MRFYDLLNFQHVMLYLFPTLIFMVVFGLALGYSHFRTRRSEDRMTRVIHQYPEAIEERDAPFPLSLTLIIGGAIIWAFFYILMTGILEVKI